MHVPTLVDRPRGDPDRLIVFQHLLPKPISSIATLWAIVDVAQKDFGTVGKKALWWVIASVPFVGFIVYLIFGFRKGKKPAGAI